MLKWDDPVAFITGATPSVRKAWQGLGIETVGELLSHLPRRYDDYSKIVAIRDAQAGDVVTVQGKVLKCVKLPSFRRRMQIFRVVIQDLTGSMSANFFQQPWVLTEFVPGREIFLSGKITIHPKYGKSVVHPLWEPVGPEAIAAGKMAPVYSLTGTLAQKTYRRLLQVALRQVALPDEALSPQTTAALSLPTFKEALQDVHEPVDAEQAERGRQRFAFEELLAYQLALHVARQESDQAGAPAIPFNEMFAKSFVKKLPFALTDDQKKAIWAALKSMEQVRPMRRLLQGDVGAGKTVVAAFLAAHAQYTGSSAVLLAPTDILAQQHAKTLQRLFAPHYVPLLLVTRTTKRYLLDTEERDLKNGEVDQMIAKGGIVIIGTHTLLVEKRMPPDVSLAIVDEQHRFGVEQREALSVSHRPDGLVPHFLSMTATPIPRSLALTMYGDLEVSILGQKPAGRLQIVTKVCRGEGRDQAYAAIRAAAARKERSFVVCPLIDPSDVLGVRALTDEFTRLQYGPLQGLRLGMVHGKLKPQEKEEIMQSLLRGDLDVLLATSVIEVGVDVPQATVMAIEGAERFGLAQLHQLRGRVGRSQLQSYCFLLTDAEGVPFERLEKVARIHDGFELAEEDLKFRGSGNLMGREQSGEAAFQAARFTDIRLMMSAKELAEEMLTKDPALNNHLIWKERVDILRKTAHLE